MSVSEEKQPEQETDRERYEHEARRRDDRPNCSPQSSSYTDRDAHNVRPGHELADAHNVCEFFVAYRAMLLDRNSASPDEATSSAEKRDLEECKEQRIE